MLSVGEAASRLGVHPGRVRQLVAAGELSAVKVGGRWLLADDAVEARVVSVEPIHRALSPRAAWGLLAAVAMQPIPWLAPSERRRAEARAAVWSLPERVVGCRRRAVRFERYVHPSLGARLADDARFVRSGVSARAVMPDVLAVDEVEGYVAAEDWAGLVDDYGLVEGGRANVRVRVPPAGLFVLGAEGEAWWPVVAVDLFEAGDDRSRRAALQLVDRFR